MSVRNSHDLPTLKVNNDRLFPIRLPYGAVVASAAGEWLLIGRCRPMRNWLSTTDRTADVPYCRA